MEAKRTCMTLSSIIAVALSSTMYHTLTCSATTSPHGLSLGGNSHDAVTTMETTSQEAGTGMNENTKSQIPIGGFDKILSAWVSYTNSSSSSPGVNVDTGTKPKEDVGYLLKTNLLADVFAEPAKEVGECVVHRQSAWKEHNRASGGTDPLMSCLKLGILKSVEELRRRGAKRFSVLGGWLSFVRMTDDPPRRTFAEEGRDDGSPERIPGRSEGGGEVFEGSEEGDLDLDHALLTALDKLTRQYSLRMEVYPDLGIRMARSRKEDAVEYSVESLHDDSEADGREVGGNQKKKKKKGGKKKELADLKKKMLLMMVPMAVQALVLPFMLLNMKLMLLKAMLAGKLAIALILFNAARAASLRNPDDSFQQEVASEHYGYGGGPEFGAWFNTREYRRAGRREPGSSVHHEGHGG